MAYEPTATSGQARFTGDIEDHSEVKRWAQGNRAHIRGFLQEHCSEWIQATGGNRAYRGVKTTGRLPMFTRTVRSDRRPLHSSEETHKWMQWVLHTAGSSAGRDNSLFVTGDETIAGSYGDRQVVLPMGSFSYTWLPGVMDWFGLIFIGRKLPNLDWLDPERIAASPLFQVAFQRGIPPALSDQQRATLEAQGSVELVRQLISDGKTAGLFSMKDHTIYDPEKVRRDVKVDQGLPEALKSGAEIMVRCDQALYLHPVAYDTVMGEMT